MLAHLKALTVVLAAAFFVFWLASRAFPELAKKGDIRRQTWAVFILSTVAFLSPSIWLYSLVCMGVAVAWWARAPWSPKARSFRTTA